MEDRQASLNGREPLRGLGHDENDRLVVLVRDPYSLYAYWECGVSRREALERFLGCRWEEVRPALRVYDVNRLHSDGEEGDWHRELPADGCCGAMFVHGLSPAAHYVVDFGVRLPNGRFVALLQAEPVCTPPDGIAEERVPHRTEPLSAARLPDWWDRFDGYTLRNA